MVCSSLFQLTSVEMASKAFVMRFAFASQSALSLLNAASSNPVSGKESVTLSTSSMESMEGAVESFSVISEISLSKPSS